MSSLFRWFLAAGTFVLLLVLWLILTPFEVRIYFSLRQYRMVLKVGLRPSLLPFFIPVFKLDSLKVKAKDKASLKTKSPKPPKTRKKEDLSSLLGFLRSKKSEIQQLLDVGISSVEVTKFRARTRLGLDDAAFTALASGAARAFLFLCLTVLRRKGLSIKHPVIEVVPDYRRMILESLIEMDLKVRAYKALLGLFSLRRVIQKARVVEY